MNLSLVKAGVLAASLIAATATAASAATWGMVEQDSVLRANHSNMSAPVNSVDEGDVVQIIGTWGQWYKVKVPGPDGWIRKYKIDTDFYDPPGTPGVQFCFNGPFGYFCANGPL